MREQSATIQAVAESFLTFAASEERVVPTYARISRAIGSDPELHAMLLEAPRGQRLPVLLLAAIHDLLLREPTDPLAAWYPTVSGSAPSSEDPLPALRSFVTRHREPLTEVLRTRQIQTNEVNRCCAWQLGLAELTRNDDRPLHLIELGASAGLNLLLDRYAYEVTTDAGRFSVGDDSSPVLLSVALEGGPGDTGSIGRFSRPSDWHINAPIEGRVGLEQNPLQVTRPDDARWLRACTWPEQLGRFRRLDAAIAIAEKSPPTLVRGDVVDDVEELIASAPASSHIVVLSSWVLVYVSRKGRNDLAERLTASSERLGRHGSRLSMLSLEADHVLPWMQPPPLAAGSHAEMIHSSVLATTRFDTDNAAGGGGALATPMARCHAHLRWIRPL